MLRKKISGFTLIEVLIYTALFSMTITSMILLANATFVIRSKVRTSLLLQDQMQFVSRRISSLIKSSANITTPSLNSTSGTLVLTMTTSTFSPTTITLQNATIYIVEGTSTQLALTSPDISVSKLSFVRASSSVPVVQMVISSSIRNADSSYPNVTVTTTADVRR